MIYDTPRYFIGGGLMRELRDQLYDHYLKLAKIAALDGLKEGGIPIGAVLVSSGTILASGRNRRVQSGDPTAHAEIDCLKNAKRLKPEAYRRSILVSTLSPCWMCTGAILLYKIPVVIIGENQNFRGPENLLRANRVKLYHLDDKECITMMSAFKKFNPDLWDEDIGEKQ